MRRAIKGMGPLWGTLRGQVPLDRRPERRDDLLQRIGADDLSDRVISEQAAILDSTVSELGG
jgi:hypothetical protein